MAAVSHRQDSKGGDLRDNGLMGSIPDYVEALGPMIGVRELYLDQMKAGHEENSSLVLQMTSARIGVWEDRLLTYYKSVRTVRTYQKHQKSTFAEPELSHLRKRKSNSR